MSRVLARLAVALACSVLLVVGLEAGSYLFGTFEGPLQSLQMGGIQIFGRHDPLLFWSLQPEAEAPDGSRWINEHGLRGPPLGPKEPDEYRILSLGESTTFAAQLPYEESYSAVLERLLNERGGPRRVRVLNAGVPGYSLFQGVQFLLHRAQGLEPDMVLLYFGFNDFIGVSYLEERMGKIGAQGLDDRELFEHRQAPAQRALAFLQGHSNLVRALLQRKQEGEVLEVDATRPRVPAEDRELMLGLALEHCQQHGLQLVILIPIYRDFERHAPLLRAFAAREGLPVVDLPALLGSRVEGRELFFLDRLHPSARGHRLIANTVHKHIAELVR